ncbi:Chaperone J-domain containing protein [Gracilaria domingensis]|nr:Chaperone J-domain containing protein [Gracilaria domingensis]
MAGRRRGRRLACTRDTRVHSGCCAGWSSVSAASQRALELPELNSTSARRSSSRVAPRFCHAPFTFGTEMPPTNTAFISPLPLANRPPNASPCTSRQPPRRPRASVSRRCTIVATIDPYDVLGVPRDADASTIKRAYRRAALKNHPDVSKQPDARDRFMRIQEAYAVLSDANKRASYDRQRASSSGFNSFAKGFGFDFDAAQYAKKWRESNPMPDDINDSLGSIFSDIFSGVAGAVGSNGVVEDFVEFLEKRVDGFGSGTDDGLNEVLKSSDVDVLETEIEDAKFVLRQLRSRKSRVEDEEENLRQRARDWRRRADRANDQKDYDVRDAAREREQELLKDADRFSKRAAKAASLVSDQEQRLQKIEDRLHFVRTKQKEDAASRQRRTSSTSTSDGGANRGRTPVSEVRSKSQQAAIDDELQKMKRELGL